MHHKLQIYLSDVMLELFAVERRKSRQAADIRGHWLAFVEVLWASDAAGGG